VNGVETGEKFGAISGMRRKIITSGPRTMPCNNRNPAITSNVTLRSDVLFPLRTAEMQPIIISEMAIRNPRMIPPVENPGTL
jgi:hypothetical protein